MTKQKTSIIENVSNDGERTIDLAVPYLASVTIVGTAALLFHRWSVDGIEEKAKAAKGSKAKKSDDVESYVYRDAANVICIPGEYLRQSIVHAAKFKQDPRSPRKSAMDLFKAGVVTMTELAPLGAEKWDFIDRRRVMVQRNGITRSRPGFYAGWKASVDLQVLTPEYISSELLNAVISDAGRLVGVGDFRPTFGRFQVVEFSVR